VREFRRPLENDNSSQIVMELDAAKSTCGHCDELEQLIRHLAGIEKHLEIITRALMGQLRR
jgi:hypothetical protein